MISFEEAKNIVIKEAYHYHLDKLVPNINNISSVYEINDLCDTIALYYTGEYNYMLRHKYIIPKKLFDYLISTY
jgi:hypothetical protein